MKLAVVSASLNPEKTRQYWASWRERGTTDAKYIIVWQDAEAGSPQRPCFGDWDLIISSPEIMGVVPAFNLGIAAAAASGVDVIAAFHDDLRIDQPGWDQIVIDHFASHPKCVLAGFSGADGLGAENIYKVPYEPHQLARQGFYSNMIEAEKHGRRETVARRSACADGFSQIGRTDFMQNAFKHFTELGIIHHSYDSWLGAKLHRKNLGSECWFLPIACHHHGGVSATAPPYAEWSKQHGGDQAIWEQAHRKFYEDCRGILPIRIKP